MRSTIRFWVVLAWVTMSLCVSALAGCTAPSPVQRSDYLSAVSCVSASSCVAVGTETTLTGRAFQGWPSGTTAPVAVRWDGSRWRPLATRLPSGAGGGRLTSVSCKPGGCLAVGEYFPAAGGDFALAEYWDDSAWAPVPLAFPPGPGNQALAAVSCVTARWCAAAGYYNSARAGDSPLAAAWDGHAWSRSQPPGPAGAGEAYLAGISCVTARYCLAVGYAQDYRDKRAVTSFTETWPGRGWAYAPAPLTASVPAGLSCLAASHCVVVGWSPDGGVSQLLDGAHWADPAMPLRGNRSFVYGVSCAGRTCLAVGETADRPAALAWNGATWTGQPTARGSTGALYGVTCVTATDCVAVGSARGASTNRSLSEFWNGTAWTIVNVNTT